MISVGSLFSGIGGLELGVLTALAEADIQARIAWQVEIDPFCRAVLARHFPETDRSVIDVRAAASLPSVDLIVGGFPCQDVSGAGRGEGLSGARSGLWWAFRDVVQVLRPGAVLVENVASGLSRWLGPVRCSLEGLGYRTDAIQIGAHNVGAPHRRERVFVLAYGHGGKRLESGGRWHAAFQPGAPSAISGCEDVADADGHGRESERIGGLFDGKRAACGHNADRCGGALAHAESQRRHEGERRERETGRGAVADDVRKVGDTWGAGRRARGADAASESGGRIGEAERGLGRGSHGLSAGMDIPARWPAARGEDQRRWEPPRTIEGREPLRRARLKALGNAVVPAQGREAMLWALSVLCQRRPHQMTTTSPTTSQETP